MSSLPQETATARPEDDISRAKKPRTNTENGRPRRRDRRGPIGAGSRGRVASPCAAWRALCSCADPRLGAEIACFFRVCLLANDGQIADLAVGTRQTKLLLFVSRPSAVSRDPCCSTPRVSFLRDLIDHRVDPLCVAIAVIDRSHSLAGAKNVIMGSHGDPADAEPGRQHSPRVLLSEADVEEPRRGVRGAASSQLAVAVSVVTEGHAPRRRATAVAGTRRPRRGRAGIAGRAAITGAAFIRGDVRGVFGRLFCDFGEAFDVLDVDGEEPHSCIIASVSNDEEPLVI